MREGAVGAMNYLRICWAYKVGCRGVNFGECWPYMSGIFQSKRKWGTIVSVPSHEHKQVWMKIYRNTPAVLQFLENNPCVVTNEQGQLYGLVVPAALDKVTEKTTTTWEKLYVTPGLERLQILSPEELLGKPTIFH